MTIENVKRGVVVPFASAGYGRDKLSAFDAAEVAAGITALNAVRVTSFVPVGWRVDESDDLLKRVNKGEFLHMAYRYACSGEDVVSAALAIGQNENSDKPGIIMEYATESDLQALEEMATSAVREAFDRRKDVGWELRDYILTKSISVRPREGFVGCALVGALYFPSEYFEEQQI
jgi:pyruvoyl-dependent arginine decarboxylase